MANFIQKRKRKKKQFQMLKQSQKGDSVLYPFLFCSHAMSVHWSG